MLQKRGWQPTRPPTINGALPLLLLSHPPTMTLRCPDQTPTQRHCSVTLRTPTAPPPGRAVDPSYYVKQAYPTAAAVPHPEMTREEFERLARMPPTTYAGGTQAWGSPLTYSGAPPAPGAETYDPSRADKAR